MIRRLAVMAAVLVSACLAPVAQAQQPQQVVNVFNWNDYIDPYMVQRFVRETGIRVRYDIYDSLETLEGRMSAGRTGYDIVVPTSEPTFSRLARAGAFRPLDRSLIPNLANIDPALQQQVASSDPENRFGALYLYGTIGLGINVDRVRALAPDAPMDSLRLMLDPANARRLQRCGIVMMDSASDVIPMVLRYLGKDPNSTSPEDLRDVERTLMTIRPFIRAFSSGGVIEALAGGQFCMAFAYSGDVIQAAARAEEANRGVNIQYIAPREGAQLWFDLLAIPADAPNPAAAHAFINFLLQPDVMANITNHVRYPNGVPASRPLVAPEVANDPSVFPTEEMRARFFTIGAVPQAAERARNRVWARFKAGR
ncbi:extracellular solute-binding protein [Falsiroseomonas stagni]|uniref:Putrescine-binding periplasmic protein n=1 Tax=Falsiroseomonas stagni DSM 19981 TaxID=1123062 RepID=A0A1I3ZHV7_9PROT|nr:extracellular solute-binding protein [Falsiroseomonas stagni]SFK43635.1 putrescine transport system substrate-binding protein [Falsiroseomonas stagni DSM 19981]